MQPIRGGQSTPIVPIASRSIMLLCLLVFLVQWLAGAAGVDFIAGRGFIPAHLFPPPFMPWDAVRQFDATTLVTHMFLHGGWVHLIVNLLILWLFAASVEAAVGHAGFVLFFVLCGVAAAFTHAWFMPDSRVPMIGASGGISGILGAYLWLFPRARLSLAGPGLPGQRALSLPAWFVLAAWFVVQLLSGAVRDPTFATIGFEAHLGGFAAGFLFVPLFSRLFRLN